MSLQQLQALLQQQQEGAGGDGGAIVKFKAGKLDLSGSTVKADPRKGQVSLVLQDGVLHFRWETRPNGQQEHDWMLFAGTATWEKVPECKDARVFLLRMAHSNKKHFFWMQEPKSDKDEEYFKTINDNLVNPGGAAGGAGTGAAGAGGVSNAFGMGGDDQAAIMRMIQAQNPAQTPAQTSSSSQAAQSSTATASTTSPSTATASTTSSTTTNSSAITSSDASSDIARSLAAALAAVGNVNNASSATNNTEGGSASSRFLASNDNSLADTLDAEAVLEVLGGQQELMEQLMPHLPEGERTPEKLRENLRSPQLRQTLNRLQSVLNSGEMAGLMHQLGLPVVNNIGAEALLEAIQEYVDREKAKRSGSAAGGSVDEDGDADME